MAKAKKKAKKAVKKSPVKSVSKKAKPSTRSTATTNSIGIQLLGDRVLIKPQDLETTTPSGIIIPDTVKKEKLMIGGVAAVGTGRFSESGELMPMMVQVGETVYFNRGWDEDGSKFSWKGEEYFLVAEGDIKAIIG